MYMRLLRFLKIGKVKTSTWIPFLLYVIFIVVILKITFPGEAPKTETVTVTAVVEADMSGEEDNSDKGGLNKIFQSDAAKDMFQDTIVLPDNTDVPSVLKFAFKKADKNGDRLLTIRELAKYINLMIIDHIDTSIKKNPQIFAEIDKMPTDGLVSWNEYHAYFLKNLKLDESYIKNHDEKNHVKLDRKSKEALMRDKARWAEVLSSDPASLTLDEFLQFQHPESSTSNLLNLVEDILRHFDMDGDDMLTVEEFTNTFNTQSDNKKMFLSDSVEERRAEFKKLIDKNHDGKADRGELLQFVDPRNSRYAIQEAATLFSLADTNNDRKLTVEEMLNKQDLFLTSKFISLIENFHNEF